jgi:hypothetical protein
MAKKGKAKSGKSARAKKAEGVKLAKNLRISGDTLAGVITSPLVRELAADILIAVASALAPSRKPKQAAANLAANAAEAGSAMADAGKDAAGLAQTATGAVAEVVAEAARRILPSAGRGEDEGPGKAGFEHVAGNGGRKKRKERTEQRREH